MKKNKFSIPLFVEVTFFIIAVIIFNYQAFQWIKNSEIQNWQLFAQNVVAGLNPKHIEEMRGEVSDRDQPNFIYVKDQLHRAMEVGKVKKVQWLYLLRVDGKKVTFINDSILKGEPDYTDPGERYIDYPYAVLLAQETKKVQIVSSYTDEWGTYTSVFVPILDWNNSKVVGILGVDIDVNIYRKTIAQKMVWPITITIAATWLLIVLIRQFNNQKILKENESLFHVLTDGVLDAMVIVDGFGKIVLWNKAAESLFKFNKSEVINKDFIETIFPKNKKIDVDNQKIKDLLEIFKNEKNLTKNEVIELKVYDRNMTDFEAEISISSVRLNSQLHAVSVIRDVSEKKRKNDEILLKNQEINDQAKAILNILDDVNQEKDKVKKQAEDLKKFEAAVNQSNEMMVFSDVNGTVLWGNPAVEKMTGFSLNEVLRAKAGSLWGGLMGKKYYEKLWHTIKDEKKVFTDVIQNHRKNGELFTSTINIYPLLDEDGNSNIFVATQRDITREIEIDRMKTDFISLASHQLRTPLSGMKWFLEMLLGGDMGKLSKEQHDAIENIDKSNERMIALVASLLNISRIESGRIIVDPEPTDLVALAQGVIDELKIKYDDKKQSLIISADKNLPKINLDPKLVRQVFLNLLTNANKYTQEKGEVVIFISQKDQDVLVQVSDDGYGIPEQEQRKIFERFYRASNVVKKETDGTGLGLYLVKAIVESSGGKIWFKSQVDKGTSFWFTFPLKGVKAKKGEVSLS